MHTINAKNAHKESTLFSAQKNAKQMLTKIQKKHTKIQKRHTKKVKNTQKNAKYDNDDDNAFYLFLHKQNDRSVLT